MQQYRVKNWERFQHYKDRNPPWIKLHFAILTSADWVMLDDASKLLAVVCILIASRNDGMVPADPQYLKRVAYLQKVPNLSPLIQCGFLESPLADASKPEQPQANASPETETYRTETEKKPPKSPLPTWLPTQDWADFLDMRRKKSKPVTDRAAELLIADLDRLRAEGHDPSAVLQQSIKNSWQGLFKLKGEQHENTRNGRLIGPRLSKSEQFKQRLVAGTLADIEAAERRRRAEASGEPAGPVP